MNISNATGNFYIFSITGTVAQLEPFGALFIEDTLYANNQTFQQQIDTLYLNGMITVSEAPSGFPLSIESEDTGQKLPADYELGEQDLIIKHEGGVSGFSVESSLDGDNYGVIKLICDDGSTVEVSSYGKDRGGAVYVDIADSAEQKPFKVNVDGDPITLNAGTATTTQIVNALIALGLVEAP